MFTYFTSYIVNKVYDKNFAAWGKIPFSLSRVRRALQKGEISRNNINKVKKLILLAFYLLLPTCTIYYINFINSSYIIEAFIDTTSMKSFYILPIILLNYSRLLFLANNVLYD